MPAGRPMAVRARSRMSRDKRAPRHGKVHPWPDDSGWFCHAAAWQGHASSLKHEHVTENAVTRCTHEQSKHSLKGHGAPPLCVGRDTSAPALITHAEATMCRHET